MGRQESELSCGIVLISCKYTSRCARSDCAKTLEPCWGTLSPDCTLGDGCRLRHQRTRRDRPLVHRRKLSVKSKVMPLLFQKILILGSFLLTRSKAVSRSVANTFFAPARQLSEDRALDRSQTRKQKILDQGTVPNR
jgi:hypothetical protein